MDSGADADSRAPAFRRVLDLQGNELGLITTRPDECWLPVAFALLAGHRAHGAGEAIDALPVGGTAVQSVRFSKRHDRRQRIARWEQDRRLAAQGERDRPLQAV